MVVLDPLDHRVQGDEARRRGDPRPVHGAAAQAVHHHLRLLDHGLAAGQHRAERSREALVEREDDRVRGRGELRGRNTERHGRIDQPGAVDVHPAVVPLRRSREGLGQRRRDDRPAGTCVRVLDDQQCGVVARDELLDLRRVESSVSRPQGRRPQARDLHDSHRLRCEDVGGGLEHDVLAGPAEHQHRGEVPHPARRHPRRGGLAEERGNPLAEQVDGGVLPELGPAELGPPHGVPHLLRRDGAEIGAQVDHRRSRCRPGLAPVCSPSSTTTVPLTITCSTPRAYAWGCSVVETSSSSS